MTEDKIMKTATLIKKLGGFRGNAALYLLSEPAPDVYGVPTSYVIVSAINYAYDTGQPETFIFPADEDGLVRSYLEIDGSITGVCDHARALANAGYAIAGADDGKEDSSD